MKKGCNTYVYAFSFLLFVEGGKVGRVRQGVENRGQENIRSFLEDGISAEDLVGRVHSIGVVHWDTDGTAI